MLIIKKKDYLMAIYGIGKAIFTTSKCPLVDCESTISRFTSAAAREHLTNDHVMPLSAVEIVLSLMSTGSTGTSVISTTPVPFAPRNETYHRNMIQSCLMG
jgi:hypothetical protein